MIYPVVNHFSFYLALGLILWKKLNLQQGFPFKEPLRNSLFAAFMLGAVWGLNADRNLPTKTSTGVAVIEN